ncbi:hypothetical protein FACS189464_1920 [Bacteroidia bacterium]|nr:hypothetical protein FACS189464_1920 [Bacteroidia bacterium]
MKKVILLVRVSTDEQSLDAQQNDVMQRALADGYAADEILTIAYKESAVKLSDDERRGLTEMYAAIGVTPNPAYNPARTNAGIEPYINVATENKIEIVYVWELSRLSRKELTLMLLKNYFCSNRIQFVCVSQGIRLLDESGNISTAADMMFSIFAITCKTEMLDKKNRFHRTKVAHAKQGLFIGGGQIKFGYMLDESKRYRIHPQEAELVQLVFNLYETGLSHIGITRELHERGVTKLREKCTHKGNNLRATHIRRILASSEYTGSHTGIHGIPRIYPVIISKEQFERCRDIAAHNNTKANMKTRYIYYCNGLIRCTCGRFWAAHHATKSYLCTRSRQDDRVVANFNDAGCANKQSISLNVLDSLCWHTVIGKEAVYLQEKANYDIEQLQANIEVYRQKIDNTTVAQNKIQQAFDRSKELYKMGDIDSAEYNSDRERYGVQHQQIRNNIINWTNETGRLQEIISQISTQYAESTGSLNERIRLVEQISDDAIRQAMVHKHIKEIRIDNYEKNISKTIEIHFVDGTIEKYVYDYRHISKKTEGRRCVTIYRLVDDTPEEIEYRFMERF